MQQKICIWLLVLVCSQLPACKPAAKINTQKKSILVYSATKGYRHESIADGIAALKQMAGANNWTITATEDSAFFTVQQLQQFAGIVFLSTTGDVLGEPGQLALIDYIHHGGGIAGVHAATDCEYNWPWYNQMMGAYFESHPAQQQANLKVVEQHPATKHLPSVWNRKDEWYNFKMVSPAIKVILMLDESSYTGGKMGAFHPAAWYQNFEGGKVFYTTLGHTKESYAEPFFLEHLASGINSVLR
jgi:uncharacterized protein